MVMENMNFGQRGKFHWPSHHCLCKRIYVIGVIVEMSENQSKTAARELLHQNH